MISGCRLAMGWRVCAYHMSTAGCLKESESHACQGPSEMGCSQASGMDPLEIMKR